MVAVVVAVAVAAVVVAAVAAVALVTAAAPRVKSTKTQALCTLRISFDIVFDALFNRGCHPIQPLQNVFDVQFHEKKDDIPPRACSLRTGNPDYGDILTFVPVLA